MGEQLCGCGCPGGRGYDVTRPIDEQGEEVTDELRAEVKAPPPRRLRRPGEMPARMPAESRRAAEREVREREQREQIMRNLGLTGKTGVGADPPGWTAGRPMKGDRVSGASTLTGVAATAQDVEILRNLGLEPPSKTDLVTMSIKRALAAGGGDVLRKLLPAEPWRGPCPSTDPPLNRKT